MSANVCQCPALPRQDVNKQCQRPKLIGNSQTAMQKRRGSHFRDFHPGSGEK